jgi:iron complex transport system permease protein
MASAMISFMLLRSSVILAANASLWLTGSLNAAGWETVAPTLASFAILAPIALTLGGRLRILQLGDHTSMSLGIRVERSRAALLGVAVGLVATGVAAAGPVSFVAFMAGPIARRLTLAPLPLVPSALVGAITVLVADTVGRLVFAPSEVPVGIVTAVIGAPFLLWLLVRANRIGSEG